MGFNWRGAAQLNIAVGGGQIPTKQAFNRLFLPIWFGSRSVHANVRFYKHYWKIWTKDVCFEARDRHAMQHEHGPRFWHGLVPERTFNDAMGAMHALCADKQRFFVFNVALKREDPASPWDFALIRARGGRLAPAYNDDVDVPFFGHK